MAPEIAKAIVNICVKQSVAHWMPSKLRATLMISRPDAVWPSASTMGGSLA